MKKAVVLLTALLTLTGASSCQQLPGIEEPAIFICTIIDNTVLECVHTYDDSLRKDISIIDAIGFQCVSPNSFATIKTHHDVIHSLVKKNGRHK